METRSKKRAVAERTRSAGLVIEERTGRTRRGCNQLRTARGRSSGKARTTSPPPAKRTRFASAEPKQAPKAAAEPKQAPKAAGKKAAAATPSGTGKKRASMSSVPDQPAASSEKRKDKGKQKEEEADTVKDKDVRETEKSLLEKAVAAAAGLGEEEGEAALQQNLASASSALHGLLRKLGAGLEDLLPSGSGGMSSSRFKSILSGLRAEGDETRQLDALTQLCELLSIGTEDTLSSFSVDLFVPVLVGLLNCEYNPDIMLLAARALTHLTDVLPSSCAAVVHYGAVPLFCARLLTIEYIDLAEQSLQALQKISLEHPAAVLRAGGLMAVLSYLDFFATGVQRVAVTTAANICRQLPIDAAEYVADAIPILTNLLHHQDTKVVENACISLTRMAENFSTSPKKLDMLCAQGLVPQAVRLISSTAGAEGTQPALSGSTYTGLLRLLATCAAGSPAVAESLFECEISGVLSRLLAGVGVLATAHNSSPANKRPPEQLNEVVSLVNELLPSIPEKGSPRPTSATQPAAPDNLTGPATRSSRRKKGPDGDDGEAVRKEDGENGEQAPDELSAREKYLLDHNDVLLKFGKDLLPVLVQVYGSSVSSTVRTKCISSISKLLYFSNAEMLRTFLKDLNISCFLAGVLASKDSTVVTSGLQMAEVLMDKLPDTFRKQFLKEGVVHAIDTFIGTDKHVEAQAKTTEDTTTVAGTPAGTSGQGAEPPPRARRASSRRKNGSKEDDQQADEQQEAAPETANPPPQQVTKTATLGGASSEVLFRIPRLGMRAAAYARARRFKATYFSCGSHNDDTTDGLRKLKEVAEKLTSSSKSKESQSGAEAIKQLLELIGQGDGVSTFEFIGSGIIGALLAYLTGQDQIRSEKGKEVAVEKEPREETALVTEQLRQLVEVALPAGKGIQEAPLTALVRKLQNSLSSIERFPVVLTQAPRGHGSSRGGSAGLGALVQPFKLRLCRASEEKQLKEYSSNVVLIEPLATVGAVEEFLWPRVKRTESPAPTTSIPPLQEAPAQPPPLAPAPEKTIEKPAELPLSPPRTRARAAAAAKAAEQAQKAEQKGGKGRPNDQGQGPEGEHAPKLPERSAGPQTRAQRRAAMAKEQEEEQVEDDHEDEGMEEQAMADVGEPGSAMEEEEPSDEEDHDEDEVMEGEEDEEEVFGAPGLLLGGTDRVHDVRLGGENPEVAGASEPKKAEEPAGTTRGAEPGPSGEGLAGLARELRSLGPTSLAAAMEAVAAAAENRSLGGSSRDRRTLAEVAASASSPHRLVLCFGGRPLERTMTIFQAIQKQTNTVEEEEECDGHEYGGHHGRRIWDEVYSLVYKRVETDLEEKEKAAKTEQGEAGPSEAQTPPADPLALELQTSFPFKYDKESPTFQILLLLKILEALNRLAPRMRSQAAVIAVASGKAESLVQVKASGPLVPQEEFLSSKLTPKLARQMQDALALCSGGLPSWCLQMTNTCPFLFPFETRRQYFYSTAFGLTRALQRLQQQQAAENQGHRHDHHSRELRIGRLQRQKVRVSRDRILESAIKVMDLYAGHKAVLEVEYFNEVGTGLGPTLEFYTLLSHELQRKKLNMWRSEQERITQTEDIADSAEGMEVDGEPDVLLVEEAVKAKPAPTVPEPRTVEHVNAPNGLFPWPWAPSASSQHRAKVMEYFRLLGRTVAKALQDNRLLDLPFSTSFYKLMLGQELGLFDVKDFEPELGRSLEEMYALSERRKALEAAPGDNSATILALYFRGSKIDDLCLDFTLPGFSDYELKANGANLVVTLSNLDEYVNLVVDASVKSGVMTQVDAFKEGFNQVFKLDALKIFREHELEWLLCGRREMWTADTLLDNIKFDHGYNSSSPPIRSLLDIMTEFTIDQQQSFLQFVTGAPRLPPGGLASLNPKLTIVRKHPSSGSAGPLGTTPPGAANALGTTLADGDLPSVMTCANYLKLPPYSCKAVMKERLLYAIQEGQGSFDLS